MNREKERVMCITLLLVISCSQYPALTQGLPSEVALNCDGSASFVFERSADFNTSIYNWGQNWD